MNRELCKTCLWYDEEIDRCIALNLQIENVEEEECREAYEEYLPETSTEGDL